MAEAGTQAGVTVTVPVLHLGSSTLPFPSPLPEPQFSPFLVLAEEQQQVRNARS